MSRTRPHTRLINETARAILRPLGLRQKGRSRTWLDDHQWWLVVVEFQPSSWARGSYLNVGAMWLWKDFGDDLPYLYFGVGHRVEGFVEFENQEQFEPEAQKLATRAAAEVKRLRRLFRDYRAAAEFLEAEANRHDDSAPAIDAGIAWGLTGEPDRAQRCFELHDRLVRGYEDRDRKQDWYLDDEAYYRGRTERALSRSHALKSLVANGPAYRRAIHGVIERNRTGLGLPPA